MSEIGKPRSLDQGAVTEHGSWAPREEDLDPAIRQRERRQILLKCAGYRRARRRTGPT